MKKVHVVVAVVIASGLLALGVARSRSGVSEVPRETRAKRPSSESAPGVNLPPTAVPVPTSGASSIHPIPKTAPSRGPEAPEDPSAVLRKRIAALKRSSRDSGETQREAIRATAECLSIEPASRSAFEEAARQSVQELESALAALKADLAVLGQKEVSPAESKGSRRLAEARYAVARRAALDRLEPFLHESARAKEFQWGFDSWAATISAQADPVHPGSAEK